jgi:hypothetical protein
MRIISSVVKLEGVGSVPAVTNDTCTHEPLCFEVEGHAALGRQQLKVEVDKGEGVEDAFDGWRPVKTKACKHAEHLHVVLRHSHSHKEGTWAQRENSDNVKPQSRTTTTTHHPHAQARHVDALLR